MESSCKKQVEDIVEKSKESIISHRQTIQYMENNLVHDTEKQPQETNGQIKQYEWLIREDEQHKTTQKQLIDKYQMRIEKLKSYQ